MSDYFGRYVYDDVNRLSEVESAELRGICDDLGDPEIPWDYPFVLGPHSPGAPATSRLLDWLGYAVNCEVFTQAQRYRYGVSGSATPARADKAAQAFVDAIDRALVCWRDMGAAARNRVGLSLDEAAMQHRHSQTPVEDHDPQVGAELAFIGLTNEHSADMVRAVLRHLGTTVLQLADADDLGTERPASARRSSRELTAESIISVLTQLGIPRNDPRGIYRRTVNVALTLLDRTMDWGAPGTGEADSSGRLLPAHALDDVLTAAWKAVDNPTELPG